MKKLIFPTLLLALFFASSFTVNALPSGLGIPPQSKTQQCDPTWQNCNISETLNTGKRIQEKWGTITIGDTINWQPYSGSMYNSSDSPFGFEIKDSVNAFGFLSGAANLFQSLTLNYLAMAGQNNPQDQDDPGINQVTSLLCATAKGAVKPCSSGKLSSLNYITIDPAQKSNTQPTAVLIASPSITKDTTTLTWSSTNADVCEAITGENFAVDSASREISGSVTIDVEQSTRYTIGCYNELTGEYSLASATVTKTANPPDNGGDDGNPAMFVVADCIYGPNQPNCFMFDSRQEACNAPLSTNYDYDQNDYMNLIVGDKLYLAGTKKPLRIPWFQNEPGMLSVWVAAKAVGANQIKKVFRIENLREETPFGWGEEYTQIMEVGTNCS